MSDEQPRYEEFHNRRMQKAHDDIDRLERERDEALEKVEFLRRHLARKSDHVATLRVERNDLDRRLAYAGNPPGSVRAERDEAFGDREQTRKERDEARGRANRRRMERDQALAQSDYWKKQLLSEQADYDKARKERDALREALIRANQRLGVLGARVLEPSRRTIAEVVADISQALAGLEEA